MLIRALFALAHEGLQSGKERQECPDVKQESAADLNVAHAFLVAPQAHLPQQSRLASSCALF